MDMPATTVPSHFHRIIKKIIVPYFDFKKSSLTPTSSMNGRSARPPAIGTYCCSRKVRLALPMTLNDDSVVPDIGVGNSKRCSAENTQSEVPDTDSPMDRSTCMFNQDTESSQVPEVHNRLLFARVTSVAHPTGCNYPLPRPPPDHVYQPQTSRSQRSTISCEQQPLPPLPTEHSAPSVVSADPLWHSQAANTGPDSQCNLSLSLALQRLDEDGLSPLHRAVLARRWCMLEQLLARLEPRTARDALAVRTRLAGETVLHLLALTADDPTPAVMLLNAGADPSVRDVHGNTALHYSCTHARNQLCGALLQATEGSTTALLEARNHDGDTCFLLAGATGSALLLRLLYVAGADVDVGDARSGRTVLHHAARAGNTQLVRFLLEELSVYVNPRDFSGRTPLTLVDAQLYPDLVMLMLRHNAEMREPRE